MTDSVTEMDVPEDGELVDENPVDRIALYAFDQAREQLEEYGGFNPFVILLEGENIHIEEFPFDDDEECRAAVQTSVFQMEKLISAYVYCYDGYAELDEGEMDGILVERGIKGNAEGEAFMRAYEAHDDHYHFEEIFYSLGAAPTFFATQE